MSDINSIKPSNQNSVNTSRLLDSSGQAKTTASSTKPSAQNDKVSLTDDATQLRALQQQISALPDVNVERVANIKAALENGQYQVDTQKLAQNVIRFEGQL